MFVLACGWYSRGYCVCGLETCPQDTVIDVCARYCDTCGLLGRCVENHQDMVLFTEESHIELQDWITGWLSAVLYVTLTRRFQPSACETLNWYAYKLMPTIVVTSTPDGLWLRIFFTWRWVSQITSPVSRALRTTRLLIYIKYHLTREQVQRESIMVKIVPIKRIKRIFYEAVLVSCCVLALIHLSLFARRQSSMT